jgi:hypothetical protein
MSDHLTTQELISKIETADRRYRRSSTVLLIIIGVAIAATLVLQYQALEQFQAQSAERAAGLKALQEEQKKESEKSNRYLQCIARYFADPNRRDTVIQDIDSCNIDPTTGLLIPGADDTKSNSVRPGDPTLLAPGPSGGPSNTPGITNPDPDTETDPNPAPPRGVIPRIVDGVVGGVNGLVDGARGILGL